MAYQPPDPRQLAVHEIAQAFEDGYLRQKRRATELLDEAESDEQRERLAQEFPHLSRAFEGRTREEREAQLEAVCLGVGVAHAIFRAMDLFFPDNS